MKILKTTIITFTILFAFLILCVFMFAIIVDHRILYPYLLFSNQEEFPKGCSTDMWDQYGNSGIIDGKFNMFLILSLPSYYCAEHPMSHGRGNWQSTPQSHKFAQFYSDYGHKVDVHLHKNSFVVIDGMTNETLLVHEISPEEFPLWKKVFNKRYYEDDFNLLKEACGFFSVPQEEYLEIQKIIESHCSCPTVVLPQENSQPNPQTDPQGQWFLRNTLPFQGEKDLCGVRGPRASLRFALG